MSENKSRRSLRRFQRRIAYYRRGMLRSLQQGIDAINPARERETSRVPTRQEQRIAEAHRYDLGDIETA